MENKMEESAEKKDERFLEKMGDYKHAPIVGKLLFTGSGGNYTFDWTFIYSKVSHNQYFRCEFKQVDFDRTFLYGLCVKNLKNNISIYVCRAALDSCIRTNMFSEEVDVEVNMSSNAVYSVKFHFIRRNVSKRAPFDPQVVLQCINGCICKIQCKFSCDIRVDSIPSDELRYLDLSIRQFISMNIEEQLSLYAEVVKHECWKFENYIRYNLLDIIDRRTALVFLRFLQGCPSSKLFKYALEFFVFYYEDVIETDQWKFLQLNDQNFCNMLVEEGMNKSGNALSAASSSRS